MQEAHWNASDLAFRPTVEVQTDPFPAPDARSPSATIKVMHLITDLEPDGAQTCMYRLLSDAPSNRYRCAVVTLKGGGPLETRLRDHGIPVYSLQVNRLVGAACAPFKLAWITIRHRPAVIMAWMYHAAVIACFAKCFALRCSIAWCIRTTPDAGNKRPVLWTLIRLGALLSFVPRSILYNSSASAKAHEANGYSKRKSRVIHNGIPCDRFAPQQRKSSRMCARLGITDEIVVSYVKRLLPDEDCLSHRLFLQAARHVCSKYGNVRFVGAGRGVDDNQPQLKRFISEHQLQDRVHLLGHLTEVRELYGCTDIAVSASIREGFPNAIAESMASGVPSVVTDVGDLRTLVGTTGIVVPPRDAEALAHAIIRLIEAGEERRRELGRLARDRIERHFSLNTMVSSYQQVLDENAI